MIIKCAWFVRFAGFISAGMYGWKYARACAFWPFVLIRGNEYVDDFFINHERIHLRQQIETLFIGLIVWDILETIFWLIRGCTYREAYLMRSSEQEAYRNQYNLDYLQERKWLSIIKYLQDKKSIEFRNGEVVITGE